MPSAKRRVVVFPTACLSGGMKGAARYAPCWAARWNPRDERESSPPQKLLTVFYRLRSLTRATRRACERTRFNKSRVAVPTRYRLR